MQNVFESSTVAAISTPYGRGGIAVIRISGENALEIAGRVFLRADSLPLEQGAGGRTYYGRIVKNNEVIDDGIAALFRAPASFTGEDTVEISCHGGILISRQVLEAVFEAGAEPAGPGEFTKRAFMNGKLSLTEAESVIDLIDARTVSAMKLARANASGALSKRIEAIYGALLEITSQAYVYADYPDEDLTDIGAGEMREKLCEIRDSLVALCGTYGRAHAVKDGIYTVIAGKPNSGKSSLLNRLLGRERAIVSPSAGTTRDFIEETLQVGNIMLRLCDTAGIRQGENEIERTGIIRSLEALDRAELVLALFDGSEPLTEDDRLIAEKLKDCGAPKIALINKCDLESAFDSTLLTGFDAVLRISAATGEGIEALCRLVRKMFDDERIDYDSQPLISSARQEAAVSRAAGAVARAVKALESGFTQDIAGLDVEEAMAALGECDGRTVSSDIVDNIFHRFCVGK